MKNKVLALAFAFVAGSAFALEIDETITALINETITTLCGADQESEECVRLKAELVEAAKVSHSEEQFKELINELIKNKACNQCQKQKEQHHDKK